MREIFRLCFEQFTDQLTFPLSPVTEWIVVLVLHEIVYRLAFSMVGDLYHSGIISGRLIGSFLHWLFRGISFAIAWLVVNFAVAAYRFVTEHWLMIIGAIGGIVLLAVAGALTYKAILQHRDDKPAANMPPQKPG